MSVINFIAEFLATFNPEDHGGNFESATRGGDVANKKRDALPEDIKKRNEGYESADILIAKINSLTKQLSTVI